MEILRRRKKNLDEIEKNIGKIKVLNREIEGIVWNISNRIYFFLEVTMKYQKLWEYLANWIEKFFDIESATRKNFSRDGTKNGWRNNFVITFNPDYLIFENDEINFKFNPSTLSAVDNFIVVKQKEDNDWIGDEL